MRARDGVSPAFRAALGRRRSLVLLACAGYLLAFAIVGVLAWRGEVAAEAAWRARSARLVEVDAVAVAGTVDGSGGGDLLLRYTLPAGTTVERWFEVDDMSTWNGGERTSVQADPADLSWARCAWCPPGRKPPDLATVALLALVVPATLMGIRLRVQPGHWAGRWRVGHPVLRVRGWWDAPSSRILHLYRARRGTGTVGSDDHLGVITVADDFRPWVAEGALVHLEGGPQVGDWVALATSDGLLPTVQLREAPRPGVDAWLRGRLARTSGERGAQVDRAMALASGFAAGAMLGSLISVGVPAPWHHLLLALGGIGLLVVAVTTTMWWRTADRAEQAAIERARLGASPTAPVGHPRRSSARTILGVSGPDGDLRTPAESGRWLLRAMTITVLVPVWCAVVIAGPFVAAAVLVAGIARRIRRRWRAVARYRRSALPLVGATAVAGAGVVVHRVADDPTTPAALAIGLGLLALLLAVLAERVAAVGVVVGEDHLTIQRLLSTASIERSSIVAVDAHDHRAHILLGDGTTAAPSRLILPAGAARRLVDLLAAPPSIVAPQSRPHSRPPTPTDPLDAWR